MCDAAGDVKSSLKTARELIRLELYEVIKRNEVDRFLNVLLSCLFILDVEPAEEVDVLIDCERFIDRDVLGNYSDLLLNLICLGAHGLAEDLDLALVVFKKCEYAVDRG